jgi:hypothetical protein
VDQQKDNQPTDLSDRGLGISAGWEICYPGDIDIFSIDRQMGNPLEVNINFDHDKGDLEAALLDRDGYVLNFSRTTNDIEKIKMVAAPESGSYLIAVWGFKGATNTYDIEILK